MTTISLTNIEAVNESTAVAVARGLDGFIRTEAGRLYAKKALALEAASRKLTAQPLPEGE